MAALKEVIWSKECYTPRTLLAQFGTSLPVIAKISSGYCPITPDDTLQSSEMVRIHSWVNQKRVLARDLRGRLLSIPEDYLIKFEVVGQQKKHNNRAKKLKDVITKFHLPLTVRFDTKTRWKFRVGDEVYESSSFGQMQLVKSYVDTYLRTNPIRNGVISTRVLLFPVSIEATMNVAQGSRNSTPSEWVTHLDMYTKALKARGVRFDKVRGVIDITVFSKETNNDVLVDGNSSPDIPMPPLTNGNGVKAPAVPAVPAVPAIPAAPPSEHEEKMTQTSASSSGGTTIEANSSMERSVIDANSSVATSIIDANSSVATSIIDANSSMTTSEVMGMSFQGRGSDTSSQHVARVQVSKDSGASPTDVSGPIAQMEELHLQPVTVEYNGSAAMNGDDVVRSGRQRTYSDGAIGERVWKEKTQRTRPSTLQGHSGGGHHHRSEKQHRVHKKHETRHQSVITRKVQSADTHRQGYYSVENVRYEAPPPLMHPTTRRSALPEGHTTFAQDRGSRIGVGRVSTSSHHAAPRHYQSMQEVYNDNNLQIGIVSNNPQVYYRDVYRYNDQYEEPMYVRQDPVPRQQVRLQQVRRNTTMPSGGYRYVNRYYENATPEYEQGYYGQRIISRPPRDYEYFEGDGRSSALGQVTVHGPGLFTTGRHRLASPQSYSSARTWMYSEDDRNDIVGRDEQGHREVSRRRTFCGASTGGGRRKGGTRDNWVSVVDVSGKVAPPNGRADSGYDDIAPSNVEYVVERSADDSRNGAGIENIAPPRHRSQQQNVLFVEDGARGSYSRQIQTDVQAEMHYDYTDSRDVVDHRNGGYVSYGTDFNGYSVARHHEGVPRDERNDLKMADMQTDTATQTGDESENASTVCAEDKPSTPHVVLVRKRSDLNNNDEYASTNGAAASGSGEVTSRGSNRRSSINSLRDIYGVDKSKTSTPELSVFSTSDSFREALNYGASPVAPVRASRKPARKHTATTMDSQPATTSTESHCMTTETSSTDVVMRTFKPEDTEVVMRTHQSTLSQEDDTHLETSARDSILDLDNYLQAQIEQDNDARSQVSTDYRVEGTTAKEGNPWYEETR